MFVLNTLHHCVFFGKFYIKIFLCPNYFFAVLLIVWYIVDIKKKILTVSEKPLLYLDISFGKTKITYYLNSIKLVLMICQRTFNAVSLILLLSSFYFQKLVICYKKLAIILINIIKSYFFWSLVYLIWSLFCLLLKNCLDFLNIKTL